MEDPFILLSEAESLYSARLLRSTCLAAGFEPRLLYAPDLDTEIFWVEMNKGLAIANKYHVMANGHSVICTTLPELPAGERADAEPAPPRRVLFSCLVAALLLFFVGFYNESIHHLQIRSGYIAYNAYSWPRLLMVPGYLLFAVIGDRNRGRLVPVAALCITLAALLNAALTDAYWINMCLFYVALSGAVSFYNLTFWRLARGTRHPALWASMGRMLDSGVVLGMGLLRVSLLPPAAVQVLSVAGLAGVILLLTASGSFNLSAPLPPSRTRVRAPVVRLQRDSLRISV